MNRTEDGEIRRAKTMILKEKDAYTGTDERGYYGHKQELDVAYQLRREFGDNDQVRIIHDLVVEHRGDRAQIDHLVTHPYGFIVIESKSIVGEVQVNAEGEWSRSYKGNWTGIPSPIRQAELQQHLLKSLLSANVEQLISKQLGIQGRLGGRDWRTLCAVSSTAILHRDKMPKRVAGRVVKTEFLSQKVKELIGNSASAFIKAKPRFSDQELDNLGSFLLEHTARLTKSANEEHNQVELSKTPALTNEAAPLGYTMPPSVLGAAVISVVTAPTLSGETPLSCKQCGETHNLMSMHGQYGYYVKCGRCNTNTSMKLPCPSCGWKSADVSKEGPSYMATCRKCEHQYIVYRQQKGQVHGG